MGNSVFDNYQFVNPDKVVFFNKFISGKFAKDLLIDYKKFIDSDYDGNFHLKSPHIHDDHLTNFNLYSSVSFEKFLNRNGLKGIRFEDISKIRESNINFNQSTINIGVVYRGIGYPKAKQAEAIAKELSKMGYDINAQFSDFIPIVMSLSDLDIQFNTNFQYNIGLKLSKNANPFYSPDLSKNKKNANFSYLDYNGPITHLSKINGKRMYSEGTDNGLSKIVLKNGSKLSSSDGGFSIPFLDSKVAIIETNN